MPRAGRWPHPLAWLVFAAGGFLLALLLWGGASTSVRFLRDLILNRIRGSRTCFMGEHIAVFSFRWLEWLFGFVSQQHVTPLASKLGWVNLAIKAGIAGAIVALGAGAALAVQGLRGAPAGAAPLGPRAAHLRPAAAGRRRACLFRAGLHLYPCERRAET
jgi:hypothetical protein